jgi:hypothetical protein
MFMLATATTGALIAVSVGIPAINRFGYQGAAFRIAIQIVVLIGLWLGVSQTRWRTRTRVVAWTLAALVFMAWLIVVWWDAYLGVFGDNAVKMSWGQVAIALPLIVGLPLVLWSRRVGDFLQTIPSSWLVAVQVYRILGNTFLLAGLFGQFPIYLALPIGLGDMLVGLLALPVAAYLHAGGRYSREIAIAWNILGILDYVDGLMLLAVVGPPARIPAAFLPVPPPIYPQVMAVVFTVPSSVLLHALSLRQLFMARRASETPPSIPQS